ncbi:MAG: undecaprenyl-diphosphate phosphatase [Roseiflexaceae bacterium]|mgnify:CR=1 FL=1|nr:undecaprenyl-diphosphate phosphatase [Roseiflexaceae bacterium]
MMSQPSTAAVPSPTRIPWALIALAVIVAVIAAGLSFSTGEARVWWEVVTLGIVEGVTEFLPISSTAHLLIIADLLGFKNSIGGTFEIFIQLGAILAVVGYYARDLLTQARAIPTSKPTQQFWLGILIAFIPAAVIGLTLHKWIKQVLFASPAVIAASLILGGIVLIVIERISLRTTTTEPEQTTFKQALWIGLAQVTALIPGVSRSGASIVGGMLAGLDRRSATAFAFYLSIPTLGAATVVDLISNLDLVTSADLARLLVGAIVSGIVAWISIGWLLRYVSRNSFVNFGIYRIIAGMLVLGLVAIGKL